MENKKILHGDFGGVPSGRENNFNIIRFFSAVMVVYGHMFMLVKADVEPLFLGQGIHVNGVCIFFILSGYLVGQSFEKDPNVLRYAVRRAFRIMPGLIVLTLITVYIIGPLVTNLPLSEYFSSPVTGRYLMNMGLRFSDFLPGVFTSNPMPGIVNSSLWSLAVEVGMYIMLPIFLFVFKKVKFKAIILAGLALLLLGVRIRYINAPVLPDVNIWNVVKSSAVIVMPYFIIGYLFTLPALKKLLNLQIAMFLLIFVAFVVLPNKLGQILAYAVLPYTVFSFALTAKPVFKNFGVKNDYTYGMYLYGFLVQQFILYVLSIRMGLNVPFYGYLILSLVGTFVFAFFSWHIVEKPMQKLSRILLKKLKRFSLSKRPPVIETDITEGA